MLNSFYTKLQSNVHSVKNCLCIGLDPDLEKIPSTYASNIKGVETFLKTIIDSSFEQCCAYKPNISFFEALGIEGLKCLETICNYLPKTHPIILDGKRGDIGNTSKKQASFIFDHFNCDATTVNPYMGFDSIEPFILHKEKHIFILALTSNKGADNFEKQTLKNNKKLYEEVIETTLNWGNNIGYVVGATQQESKKIRQLAKNRLLLIPGIGTQGGNYTQAFQEGKNKDNLAIINASRTILYGSNHTHPKKEIQKLIQKLITLPLK